MTIKVGGGGSPYPFPTLPAPLKDEGRLYAPQNRVPHKGTLIDGVDLPRSFTSAAAGGYQGLLDSVEIWEVLSTDINAACNGFLSENTVWYDSVNDRLYVWGIDTTTTNDTLYTAYITLETGAVTNVGNAQLTADIVSPTVGPRVAVSRPAIDSGNFTLHAVERNVVINESTGGEVSNVVHTSFGAIRTYATLDATAFMGAMIASSTTNRLDVMRGDGHAVVSPPTPYFTGFQGAFAIPWGDKVKLYSDNAASSLGMLRTFDRVEFDVMLQEIADFGGLA